MKGKLFHSFGAAARKVQSSCVVGVTTLAPCMSPLFDLKLYLPLSSILISSQRVTLQKICNPCMESPDTVDKIINDMHASLLKL